MTSLHIKLTDSGLIQTLMYYVCIICQFCNRIIPNIINVKRFLHSYNKFTSIQNVHVCSFNSIPHVKVSNQLILITLLFRIQWLPRLKLTLIVPFLPSENQPNLYYLNLIYCACLHCQDYCFTGVRLDMIIFIRPGVI